MRFAPAVAAFAALISAAPAVAGGINLSWDDCGATGVGNKTFACNTNAGSAFRLYASFVAPPGIDRLNGCESEVLFDFPAAAVPAWWSVHNPGTCRPTSLNLAGTISEVTTCLEPWQGFITQGFAWTMGYQAPNRARFRMSGAMPPAFEVAVPAGTEAYAYEIVINRARTVGTTCIGCDVGACITLASIKLNELTDQPGVIESTLLTNPVLRQHATWQTGYPACPNATPAQARTWGGLKSIYR